MGAGGSAGPQPLASDPSFLPSSAGPDSPGLPLQLDAPSLLSPPSFILTGTSAGYAMVPSPPSCHKPLVPLQPVTPTVSTAPPREDPTPSTSASRPSAPPASRTRTSAPEASDSAVPALQHSGGIGLALFGVGLADKALFQSLLEENGCCLLYVVEDQLEEVQRAFGAEFLAGTRVLRQQDADAALSDQRY